MRCVPAIHDIVPARKRLFSGQTALHPRYNDPMTVWESRQYLCALSAQFGRRDKAAILFADNRDFGPVGGLELPRGRLIDQLQLDALAGES